MMMKKTTAVSAALLLGSLAAAGFGTKSHQQPQPQPAPCIEADGEPCDDDPFDLDDIFEKKKVTPKPVPTPTAVKTAAPMRTVGSYTPYRPKRR
jgi:hypothetical protein